MHRSEQGLRATTQSCFRSGAIEFIEWLGLTNHEVLSPLSRASQRGQTRSDIRGPIFADEHAQQILQDLREYPYHNLKAKKIYAEIFRLIADDAALLTADR